MGGQTSPGDALKVVLSTRALSDLVDNDQVTVRLAGWVDRKDVETQRRLIRRTLICGVFAQAPPAIPTALSIRPEIQQGVCECVEIAQEGSPNLQQNVPFVRNLFSHRQKRLETPRDRTSLRL